MNLFGKEPQEQAMQMLIHDTNSHTQQLRYHIKMLSEWVKKNHLIQKEAGIQTASDSTPYVLVEYLKSDEEKIKNAIDTYYKEFEKF